MKTKRIKINKKGLTVGTPIVYYDALKEKIGNAKIKDFKYHSLKNKKVLFIYLDNNLAITKEDFIRKDYKKMFGELENG